MKPFCFVELAEYNYSEMYGKRCSFYGKLNPRQYKIRAFTAMTNELD